MEPTVAFVVDHPQRDLGGVALTAHAVCQAGVTCHLVPMNLQQREIWALRPDVVVLNYARRGNEQFARQLAAAGIRLGIVDTEGGVWSEPENYAELLWEDASVRRLAGVVCMWGPRLAAYVVERGLFAAHQVQVTGCPRVDFYHESWQTAARAEPARARPERSRLLINTNFTVTNPRFASAADNIEQCRRVYGWPEQRVARLAVLERVALDAMIALAADLAQTYPECETVVRPHPFEDPAPYRRALGGIPGIRLSVTGPVQPEILGAAAVVQRSCSTAIEAGLAGVPALSPRWFAAPVEVPSAESVSLGCESPAMLRTVVRSILEGRFTPPPQLACTVRAVIRDWFLACDGEVHRRIADAVLRCLPPRHETDARACAQNLYGIADQSSPWHRAAGRLRRGLHLRPDRSLRTLRIDPGPRWASSDKHFSAADVGGLALRIEAAARRRGRSLRRVAASAARESRAYSHHHHGFAVTMRCDDADRC